MGMKRHLRRHLLSFVLIVPIVFVDTLWAQSQLGTGAVRGVVTDPSGTAVLGAIVTVTNTGTGLVRRMTTEEAGLFNVPVLPIGQYTVRVEKSGFATQERTDLTVNVGSTATLQIQLTIEKLTSVVEVTAAAPVDTTRTAEMTFISREQINELPINGRRVDQFALLSPGVTRDGRFGLLSYNGVSGVFNNYTVEGNDDNQAYFSEARGRTRIASNISANAIQEFQVAKTNFLPEYGRTAGGGINSVIRSGTNTFHADGFYYYRDQRLGARDPLATIAPDERRQQFGGSAGGPVRKDRLFYFANYDEQRRNFPLLTQDTSGVLTNGRPDPQAALYRTDPARYDADLAAFTAGVNFLQGKFPGGAPGNALPRRFDQNLILAKVDWLINSSNTLSTSYNYLNSRALNGVQTVLVTGSTGSNGSDDVRTQNVNVRLTSAISSRKINEFRFHFSRDFEFEFGNQPPPNVSVGGFAFGRATYLERFAYPDERKLQFVDNFSFLTGSHSLKFGAEAIRSLDLINSSGGFGGAYSYTNALTLGKDLLNPASGNYSNYSQTFGLQARGFSTVDYAAFAQDQWQLATRLVLNYGVRYDLQALPKPVAPNPAIPETQKLNVDRTNIGPRVGAAYDIGGNGRTVLRAGYAVIYGRTPNALIDNVLRQTGLQDPATNTFSISFAPTDPGAPRYPAILPGIPSAATASTTVTRLDRDYRRPRVQQVNLGVEQRISASLTVSASFIYTKGDRLAVSYDQNMIPPAFTRTYQFPDGSTFRVPFSAGLTRTADGVSQNVNLSRPNPNYGRISVTRSLGESWYKALFVEVKRRFAGDFQMNVAYTLSNAENLSGTASGDGSGSESPTGGSGLVNQFNLTSNRGISPTNQRHRLVASGIWNLPFHSDNPSLNRMIRGFRLSGIFTAESGRPYSAFISVPSLPFSTPDGAQYNGFGGLYGQGGSSLVPTIPRNSNAGERNYRLDMRVARDIRLNDRFTLELFAEGFNLFNRANFNGFSSTMYTATATTATTPLSTPVLLTATNNFGRATADGAPPDGTNARRFQLAARFRF